MQDFVQNKNHLNLGPKLPNLGIFRQKFEKNYWNNIWRQHARVFHKAKIHAKQKKLQMQGQKCLIWVSFGLSLSKPIVILLKNEFLVNEGPGLGPGKLYKACSLGVFIDFSKAFDTVDHQTLIKKLQYYVIDGIALEVFQSYFINRKHYITSQYIS